MDTAATRATTMVLVVPVDHFAGARHTRRQWMATLATRETREQLMDCGHHHGHKTTTTAVECGIKMWRELPQ